MLISAGIWGQRTLTALCGKVFGRQQQAAPKQKVAVTTELSREIPGIFPCILVKLSFQPSSTCFPPCRELLSFVVMGCHSTANSLFTEATRHFRVPKQEKQPFKPEMRAYDCRWCGTESMGPDRRRKFPAFGCWVRQCMGAHVVDPGVYARVCVCPQLVSVTV